QTDELSQIDIKDSGWVVQLGSFKHQKNVKELLKTLTDAGYRAYSRPVMTSVGELTKVFVGPELDKEKLELALPHLQEITKLKGKITAFEVSAG
ncbi:MAG: DedD protein, partial [Glaciecola sp.]